jgi:hypothetical protein
MKLDLDKTIEAISVSHNKSYVWDDVDDSISEDIIYSPEEDPRVIRLLGPFQLVKRLWVGQSNNDLKQNKITRRDLARIADGDTKTLNEKLKVFQSTDEIEPTDQWDEEHFFSDREKKNKYGGPKDIIGFLNELHSKSKWQKCLMVNGFIYPKRFKSADVKIVAIPRLMCDSLFKSLGGYKGVAINGLYAKDITISKQYGRTGNISVSSETTHLEDVHLQSVLKRGLWDIPPVLSHLNTLDSHTYIYKTSGKYRMPEEMYSFLSPRYKMKDYKGSHYEDVFNNIGEISTEEMGYGDESANTINDLEF